MSVFQGSDQPVVEHDQIHVVQGGELVLVGSICSGDIQVVQQPRRSEVPS